MGRFIRNENGIMEYVNGEMDVWEHLDSDTLNVFDLHEIVKVCKRYHRIEQLLWRVPNLDIEFGMRQLNTDRDVLAMARDAMGNGNEIELYYEHPIMEADPILPLPCSQEDQVAAEDNNVAVEDNVVAEEHEGDDGADEDKGSDEEDERVVEDKVSDEDKGADEGSHSSTDESAEDSHYKPPPIISSSDEEEVPQRKRRVTTPSKAKKNRTPKRKKAEKVGTSAKGKKVQVKGKGKRSPSPSPIIDSSSSDDSFDMAGYYGGEGSQHMADYCRGQSSQHIPEGICDDGYKSEEMKDPISTDEEDVEKVTFPQFNEEAEFGSVSLELGMEFSNLASFKAAVKEYTIHLGRPIKWVKNDKERARAKCKEDGCKWEVFCGRTKDRGSFQIKTFESYHSCSRHFKVNQANRKWVVQKLVEVLRCQPKITSVEIFDFVKKEFKIIIDRSMIFRALREARELVEGSERDQYGKVWDYANELSRSNPGSLIKIDTIPQPESAPQFHRFFVCLDASKRGFKAGCRPFIGLDGCFLKGYYGGQLLSAVATDANGQIFVLAYAIVDVENKDNWMWFLTLLHEQIGDYTQHGWNFMSDMQKGLIPAVQELMPGVPHRYCAMHLWRNFTKQWKEKELRGVVWECSRSTTVSEFKQQMEKVKGLNKKALEYLDKWPKVAWTKAYFKNNSKVDNITNNCEVFNSAIVNYRGKPILTMAEEIRCYVMRTMSENKVRLNGKAGPLCPYQQSRLDKQKIASNHWNPVWSDDEPGMRFEVQNPPIKVDVDLSARTCTCRFWQLTGMPCEHACAAIAYRAHKPEDYCHGWLTIGAYKASYNYFVQPTQSEHYWTPTGYCKPVPPKVNRSAGRPKKNRRKDGNEEPVGLTKLKKTCPIWICQRCGLEGHNSRGCMNQGVPKKPKTTKSVQVQQEEGPTEIDLSQDPLQSQDPVQSQDTTTVDQQSAEGNSAVVKPTKQPVQRGRRYGVRGPLIPENAGVKATPVRAPNPLNLTPPSTVLFPSPTMVPIPPQPGATQSVRGEQLMQFIPTPGLHQYRPRQQ